MPRAEAAWNDHVHGPILSIATAKAPDVGVESVTRADIARRLVPPTQVPLELPVGGKMIDYAMVLRPADTPCPMATLEGLPDRPQAGWDEYVEGGTAVGNRSMSLAPSLSAVSSCRPSTSPPTTCSACGVRSCWHLAQSCASLRSCRSFRTSDESCDGRLGVYDNREWLSSACMAVRTALLRRIAQWLIVLCTQSRQVGPTPRGHGLLRERISSLCRGCSRTETVAEMVCVQIYGGALDAHTAPWSTEIVTLPASLEVGRIRGTWMCSIAGIS